MRAWLARRVYYLNRATGATVRRLCCGHFDLQLSLLPEFDSVLIRVLACAAAVPGGPGQLPICRGHGGCPSKCSKESEDVEFCPERAVRL